MILVLNCGSQSIKWKIFGDDLKPQKARLINVSRENEYESLLENELTKVKEENISLIGHRFVHGGSKFRFPLEVKERHLPLLEKLKSLAPLHNPFNLLGIKFCLRRFPVVKNIAIFDTEFFCDLPPVSRIYPLPEEIRKKFGFQRYGFHGISHEYAAREGAKKINKPFEKLKIITCHLGGGSSIAAIKKGKAIDTSMGYTPLEGVMMTTRSGSIDPGIILELSKKFSIERLQELLNRESGIKGICGEADMLRVLEKLKEGRAKARLAIELFVYSIKKYIGAYYAILGGCDLLVFTGAIGSGSSLIRRMIVKDLLILRSVKVLAIPPDEEKAIAIKIKEFLKK